MDAGNGNGRRWRRDGDDDYIEIGGLPSWPVPYPDADHEWWLQIATFGQDAAVEIRSDQPITIEAMRRIADELQQVASSLEDELPDIG